MRVLWFSPISFSGKGNDVNHNGGGWIGALLSRVRDNPSLSLAIAYIGDGVPYEQNGVRFFPIPLFSSMKNRLRCKFSFAQEAKILKTPLQGILANFQPDLIQIFGSENVLGMVCSMTDIPCVIHLQGFLPAYYNALLPPKIGWGELLTCSSKLPNRLLSRLWCSHIFKKRAERESGIVKFHHKSKLV